MQHSAMIHCMSILMWGNSSFCFNQFNDDGNWHNTVQSCVTSHDVVFKAVNYVFIDNIIRYELEKCY